MSIEFVAVDLVDIFKQVTEKLYITISEKMSAYGIPVHCMKHPS